MDDLIKFLRARLDEDEQALRVVARLVAKDQAWMEDPPNRQPGPRTLRDIESKRQIVDDCEHALSYEDYGYTLAESILRAMGAVYLDHPDYRQEWR